MTRRPSGAQAQELRRLMQQLFRRFGTLAADATPCGKPLSIAHAHALMVLQARGDLTQQDLGAELFIDKSNVARLCARMAAAGHVEQQRGEADGRRRVVSLTTMGARLAREVNASSGARFGALLKALPPSSRDQVLEALQQLVAVLDSLPPATTHDGESQ